RPTQAGRAARSKSVAWCTSALVFSLGTSRGNLLNAGLCAREFDVQSLHADRSFDGSTIESAGEEHISRRTLDGNVNREAELIGAEIAADDVGVAARDGERPGKGAVAGHYEIDRGLFRPFGRGVGQLPFSCEVALGRVLGLFRFAGGEFAAVDKNKFDLGFFVEDVAVGDN